ncbi:MAG: aminomethyl transferase family protein [Desulfamplus sp.]|nr:aminomethyl transferase family protein [Desulfamplus sp.]
MKTTTLKTTPLNSWHRSNGANMANFGGFDMPLWYEAGVKLEHLAVVESAGIFDTSHMACVLVTGKDSFGLLQLCHTRDISALQDGRCVYGTVLNEKAHVIDDAIVYRFDAINYMVCVNAGMGGIVAAHFQNNRSTLAAALDRTVEVTVTDLSEKVAKMDIQGKNSIKVLKKILDPSCLDPLFDKMPYFSFKGDFSVFSKTVKSSSCWSSCSQAKQSFNQIKLKNGTPLVLSRSGYTGEFGFEIFISPDAIVELWQDILEAGKEYNLIACGLGARDSLRAGAVLPLSHQDIGGWKFINTPWDFALPYNADNNGFTKSFIGCDALLNQSNANQDSLLNQVNVNNSESVKYTYPFIGEDLRKIGAGADSQVLDGSGNVIGMVLTCATDMAIGWHNSKIYSIASPNLPEGFKAKGISCGFVLVDRKLEIGTKLVLQEKKRKINVTVVNDVRPDRTARQKISTFL